MKAYKKAALKTHPDYSIGGNEAMATVSLYWTLTSVRKLTNFL
jgi:curved DNA-binding protein CbpA